MLFQPTVMQSWHWVLLSLCLLVLELLSGSGFLLWIAIGAMLTAATHALWPQIAWPVLLWCFAIYSLVACYLWWRYMKRCTERNDAPLLNRRTSRLIGRKMTLATAIQDGRGQVKIGDGYWTVAGRDCPEGTVVQVIDVDGIILQVEPATSLSDSEDTE